MTKTSFLLDFNELLSITDIVQWLCACVAWNCFHKTSVPRSKMSVHGAKQGSI